MCTEEIPLEESAGRVLAESVRAALNVPPFARSPYDGFAVRAEDCLGENPLRVLETIPAGRTGRRSVERGTAVRIMTGAPVPPGADAVVPFEQTRFTEDTVTVLTQVMPGSNVVPVGEDVRAGSLLASAGTRIDAGLLGVLAGQNRSRVCVYRRPRIGIISTGTELVSPGEPCLRGQIYDTCRYSLQAAMEPYMQPVFLGCVPDDTDRIAQRIRDGRECCDAVLLTGGVSVGDYDLTERAMVRAGARVLFDRVALKPGMACCCGVAGGTLICGLSGNPASCMTSFYALVLPALRKRCGLSAWMPEEFPVKLGEAFEKKSRVTRLLRGRLDLASGEVVFHHANGQGNGILRSFMGVDALAEIPAGSGPVAKGTTLRGFRI